MTVVYWLDEQHEDETKRKSGGVKKTINQLSGLSGCEIKGFGMAYYLVPCGLITTVFSVTFSSLVTVPNLRRGGEEGGLSSDTTIVQFEVRTTQE